MLGLIASTVEGIEILDELGWESVTSPLERSPGICVPQQISQFLDVSLDSSALVFSVDIETTDADMGYADLFDT